MKKALGWNALFSAASGIILITFNHTAANVFGVKNTDPFWIIGVVLISFSLTILYEMKRQNLIAILWIITQDFLWVSASMILLIWQPFALTNEGYYIIAIVALIVLLMAINQSKALARVDSIPDSNRKQLEFSRTVAAPKSRAWKIVADVGNYHKVASNIDAVKILSGEKEGMVRQCSHGNDSWTETCSLWQDEKMYAFLVNTSAPDFPYPLSYMKGTWKLEESNFNHTIIKMIFQISYKRKIQNLILHPFMQRQFDSGVKELLDKWQQMIEEP